MIGRRHNYPKRKTMTSHLSKRMLDLTARVILGSVFIYSGIVKSASPIQFADSIASYNILSPYFINLVATSLPLLEIACGFFVLTGFYIRVGLLTIFAMLAVFTAALLSAIIRGLSIECGCFGESSWLEANPWIASSRDLVLLAMAGYLYIDYLIAYLRRIQNISNQNIISG